MHGTGMVKSCFNNMWVVVVKNGPGHIDYGALQSAVSL